MEHAIFQKAVRLLVHPLSLAAMGLMALNDLLFKPLAPSWLSGKLSDLAALFFFPFLLIALLTAPMPKGWRRAGRAAAVFGFAAIPVAFTLVKLLPGVGLALTHTLPGLSLTPDPADLFALPAALAAVALWRCAPPPPLQARRWWLAVLPLSALLCLADAAAPFTGLTCVWQDGTTIAAEERYGGDSFQSSDGGITWISTPLSHTGAMCQERDDSTPWLFQNPLDGSQLRFSDQLVEISTDAGATWKTEFHLSGISEAELAYKKRSASTLIALPLPQAGLADPATGNLVFAMGTEGVLVRLANGEWRWVSPGGRYQHAALAQAGFSGIWALITDHLLLLPLFFLAGLTSLLYTRLGWSFAASQLIPIWLWLAGLLWVDVNSGYTSMLLVFSYPVLLIWLLLLLIHYHRKSGALRGAFPVVRLALFSACAALVTLLPYALWAAVLLPYIWQAHILALLLMLAVLVPNIITGKTPKIRAPQGSSET